MLTLNNNLEFVNVDTEYIKYLHQNDNEVQYSSIGYDEKPFLGLLLLNKNMYYVIPLTSAKKKHIKWKDRCSDGRFLVTGIEQRCMITAETIYKEIGDVEHIKRIYAAIDVKKMIPVKDDLFQPVRFNIIETDSEETKNYKILLNKEYQACVKIVADVIKKADTIYSKQMSTGKVSRFCANYKHLEKACQNYDV